MIFYIWWIELLTSSDDVSKNSNQLCKWKKLEKQCAWIDHVKVFNSLIYKNRKIIQIEKEIDNSLQN